MLSIEDRIKLLRSIRKTGFFWSCSLEQIKQLISVFVKMEFREGQQITRKDEEGNTFFIIDNGEISIWAENDNKKEKINTLKQGDYFTETTFFTNRPRNTTIIAEKHCKVFVLFNKEFKKYLIGNPILKKHFLGTASQESENLYSYRIYKNSFTSCVV